MRRLFATLGILTLPALACNLGGETTSTATVESTPAQPIALTRTSLPFATPRQPTEGQHPCGDGVCDAAEQANSILCPADCQESGGALPAPTMLPVATASPVQSLPNRLATHQLPEGTHRPEILVTESGELIVVVVQPAGRPGVGQVKHKAYRFHANWAQIGEPFVVTQHTAEYGEPADHRAALANGELVVMYQSLSFEDETPPQGATGPLEQYAKDQSLLLADFSLDGTELFREPIVAHAVDRSEDNFPDQCLLWLDNRPADREAIVRVASAAENIECHLAWTSNTSAPVLLPISEKDTARQDHGQVLQKLNEALKSGGKQVELII